MKKIIGTVLKYTGFNTISVVYNNVKYNKKLDLKFTKRKKILVNFVSTFVNVGDKVSIYYKRKFSKRKSWELLKILK
ncbi:30S ribosomal protein S17 [Candidatus Vidania fulgoroideorum]